MDQSTSKYAKRVIKFSLDECQTDEGKTQFLINRFRKVESRVGIFLKISFSQNIRKPVRLQSTISGRFERT